ncbi:ICC-like protein phosphoesterase [Thermococcus sp. 2319x1]|uniref:metallophosphoesterase n=1 Tax=Thermococcus sp. 2319x1 TaxID=1674923 RepID=UPI00073AE294|nr:metallophosphoesterase [Thermococcus sp. 2319x1]ALV62657.1 ICC-like protein phosphoesterase [Thermococcus sp. 2319x1]
MYELLPQKAIKIKNSIIIADLHIGYEESMAKEGIYLPKAFRQMVNSVLALLREERPKRLIINGDLKHSFIPLKREKLELKAFFGKVTPLVEEIVVVRGNHDVGISWVRELGVEVVDELEIGKWKIVHGHKLVEGEKFIIGHEHPAIRLRDEVGALIKVPIFLVGDPLIVLPAFSPWAYGNDILREIVSPFLRDVDLFNFKVLVPLDKELLDFGKLGDLIKALQRI